MYLFTDKIGASQTILRTQGINISYKKWTYSVENSLTKLFNSR